MNTSFERTKNGIYVQCGCWFGEIEDFRKQVNVTHGENQFANEYLAAIELVKIRFKRKSKGGR